MSITAEQMRAARALIRMEQSELAKLSGLSLPTIKRLETQNGTLQSRDHTIAAIVTALQDAGIAFLAPDKHGGLGIRLTTQPADPFRKFAAQVANAAPDSDVAALIEEAKGLLRD